jgi:hypothetical protein
MGYSCERSSLFEVQVLFFYGNCQSRYFGICCERKVPELYFLAGAARETNFDKRKVLERSAFFYLRLSVSDHQKQWFFGRRQEHRNFLGTFIG